MSILAYILIGLIPGVGIGAYFSGINAPRPGFAAPHTAKSLGATADELRHLRTGGAL